MDKSLVYGSVGCFIGTLISLFVIQINPMPFLLVLLPMWGLVMGVSISRVMYSKDIEEESEEDIFFDDKKLKKANNKTNKKKTAKKKTSKKKATKKKTAKKKRSKKKKR